MSVITPRLIKLTGDGVTQYFNAAHILRVLDTNGLYIELIGVPVRIAITGIALNDLLDKIGGK